jgi:hypothetical protein
MNGENLMEHMGKLDRTESKDVAFLMGLIIGRYQVTDSEMDDFLSL